MSHTHEPNTNHGLDKRSSFQLHNAVSNISATSLTTICTQIVTTILQGYDGHVAVQLWNGKQVVGKADADCCLVFKEPGVIRDLILYRSLSRLTKAYLDGIVDVNGNMEYLLDFGDYFKTLKLSWTIKWRLLRLALKLPVYQRQSQATENTSDQTIQNNSRASIAHHYDVGNDFYRLWLDPEMVYSCAYFSDEQQTLGAAQQDKLDYLCRKLRLRHGQTLLDIGCGWGALAIYAARHYGVKVHGITLSEAQQRFAQKRVADEGLQQQVKIELRDYRDLPEQVKYDKVVSVGMFEHVGIKNFPTYFATVKRILKPGGLFLNHGITSETRWKSTPVSRFINRYIFPDGQLTRVSDVANSMERAGFEILDIEGLRRHYTYTLRHWVKALESNHNKATVLSSEVTYRLWRLYMAGSAFYFDEGSLGVHQLLVGHLRAPLNIPIRRNDLYS